MSNQEQNPGEAESCSDKNSSPPFLKPFEEVIQSYAKAESAGQTEAAEAAALQALMMASEEALNNPTPSMLLQKEADELESQGDWTQAEIVRRKLLALEEASGNFGLIAKAQMELCRLLRWMGRLDDCWQFACAATASARRTEIFPVLVMALENEVFCALDRSDATRALAAISEALTVIEPGALTNLMRAQALTTRARCLVANGDLTGAEADLSASWELLNNRPFSVILPGPVLRLAHWWEVKSQLEEHQGNIENARKAMTQAVEFRRQISSPKSLFSLARALEKLGELYIKSGDSAGSEGILSEAKSIRQQLHLPGTS